MGHLRKWIFGEDDTPKQSDMRSVHDMQSELLSKSVSRRAELKAGIQQTAPIILSALDKFVFDNFSEGRILFKIECPSRMDEEYNLEIAGGDSFSIRYLSFSIGDSFTISKQSHKFASEAERRTYQNALFDEVRSVLEQKGFRIEKTQRQYEVFLSWKDEAFNNALRQFDDPSQVDAFQAGVPVEDILA